MCIQSLVVARPPRYSRLRAYGVSTSKRHPNLADHSVAAVDVVKDWYEKCQQKPDYVLLLQPTHPFRQPSDIDSAIDTFVNGQSDCMLAVTREDVLLGILDGPTFIPEFDLPRDKSKEPNRYRNTGSFYLFRPSQTFLSKSKFGKNLSAYVLPSPELEIDIDHPPDLHLAEALLAANQDRLGFYNRS